MLLLIAVTLLWVRWMLEEIRFGKNDLFAVDSKKIQAAEIARRIQQFNQAY